MAFVPSKAKKNPPQQEEMPNLTSMMDMMTIILLFLLKTIVMSGAVMPINKEIDLPESSTQIDPQRHISFIASPQGIFQDNEGLLGEMLASPEETQSNQVVMYPRLLSYLDSIRQFDSEIGRSERRIITLQGDREIEYRDVYKFISTCGEAGFSTIQFIVAKKEK
jgi:biopolymer transport protein ExbD